MNTYFIRVHEHDRNCMDEYLDHHDIMIKRVTYDFNKTMLYCVEMDKEEALRMRLSTEMLGMMEQPRDYK